MDTHLKHIPSLTTLTIWRLSCRNLEILGRQANRSLDSEILGLGTVNELGAYFLERFAVAGCQGDADLVDFLFVKWLVYYWAIARCETGRDVEEVDVLGLRQSLFLLFGKTFWICVGVGYQDASIGNVMI